MDHALGIIGLVVIGAIVALYLRTGIRRPGRHGQATSEAPYITSDVDAGGNHHGGGFGHD